MSASSIMEKLKALENNPKFKGKIGAAVKGIRKKNSKGGSGGTTEDKKMADERIEMIAGRAANAVFRRLPYVAMQAGNSAKGLFDIFFKGVDQNGDYQYELMFKPEVVHRPSLWPEGYPEGLTNIVSLYSHGGGPSKGPIWNTIYGWLDRKSGFKLDRGRNMTYDMFGAPFYIQNGGTFAKGEHQAVGLYQEGWHIYLERGWKTPADSFLRDEIDAINADLAKDNIKVTLNRKYYP